MILGKAGEGKVPCRRGPQLWGFWAKTAALGVGPLVPTHLGNSCSKARWQLLAEPRVSCYVTLAGGRSALLCDRVTVYVCWKGVITQCSENLPARKDKEKPWSVGPLSRPRLWAA